MGNRIRMSNKCKTYSTTQTQTSSCCNRSIYGDFLSFYYKHRRIIYGIITWILIFSYAFTGKVDYLIGIVICLLMLEK